MIVKLQGHDLKVGRDSGMIIFEVPPEDTANFRMKRNDLTAFDYLWNARFRLMDCEFPANCLLGPPGKGLAQAFSSLAKGRGGIGVNSAAKTFKLLAHLILDPEFQQTGKSVDPPNQSGEPNGGGWTSFRARLENRSVAHREFRPGSVVRPVTGWQVGCWVTSVFAWRPTECAMKRKV